MKHIQKAGWPHDYAQWCAAVAGTDKSDWREVPAVEKEGVLSALILEQGGLCAYTMRRIDKDSSHVEHIKPRSRCRADLPGSDLEYGNLIACFPRDGMNRLCRYGAQKKGGWWEDGGASFISPLQASCEHYFRFDIAGNIVAVGDRAAALKTIRILALNHDSLTEDRKRVIEEIVFGRTGDAPLSVASARRIRNNICHREDGRFYEFCVAIRDALEEYLTFLRKRRRRRKVAAARS